MGKAARAFPGSRQADTLEEKTIVEAGYCPHLILGWGEGGSFRPGGGIL